MNTRVRKFAMHGLSYCCLVAILTFCITSAAWGDLTTSFTLDGNVGAEVAAFPAGFATSPSGTLTLSSIPVGATINHAALYAINYFDAKITPSATFAGTSLGSTSAFDTSAFGGLSTYKWTVPVRLITGNGGFVASATGLSNNYGLALVVVFSHSSLPLRRVIVNDGATNLNGGSPNTASTSFSLTSVGTGTLWIHTGADNAGESGEVIRFNETAIGGPIDANLGQFASLFNFSVTTVTGTNTAQISALSGDHFGWDLAVLSTTIPAAPTITTVAGTGVPGFSGDGGLATSARLNFPRGVAAGASFYIADRHNHRIRRVDDFGNITTVAGNGVAGFSGDGGEATSAQLNLPSGVALGADGNLYIADFNNQRIRKVVAGLDGVVSGASDETITTVAGNGIWGSAGDGGLATAAKLWNPKGVAVSGNNLYIADEINQKIRRVNLDTGKIFTVAGTGIATGTGSPPAPLGDGGSATAATLNGPTGVAVDLATGDLYIADEDNNRIRKVVPGPDGAVTGPDVDVFNAGSGEDITTVATGLNAPIGVAVGSLFIAEKNGHRILKVDLATLAITTFAGTGTACPTPTSPCGDGGPPTAAQLKSPAGVAVDGAGNVYIADMDDHKIRRVGSPVVAPQ